MEFYINVTVRCDSFIRRVSAEGGGGTLWVLLSLSGSFYADYTLQIYPL